MPTNIGDGCTGVVTTSGVETVVITEYTVPNDTVGLVDIKVTGQNLSTGASCGGIKSGLIKKIGSGDVQIIGSISNVLPIAVDTALIGAGISIDVSGDKIQVKGTGVLLQDIEWYGIFAITLRTQLDM